MKKILYLFVFLLVIFLVSASLENYPEPFVKNHYTDDLYAVLGRSQATNHAIASTNVVLGLAPINGNFNTRFEDEISSLNHNFIVIGNPCENTLTQRLLNTNNCNLGLTIGEGAIKHIVNNGYNSIIVIGTDKDSLIRASLVLKNYMNYDLDGDSFIVDSSGSIRKGELTINASGNVITKPVSQTNTIKSETCDGCLADKTCVKKNEIVLGKYCDGSKLIEQKKDKETCALNIECSSGMCLEGRCNRLSIIDRLKIWFKGLIDRFF